MEVAKATHILSWTIWDVSCAKSGEYQLVCNTMYENNRVEWNGLFRDKGNNREPKLSQQSSERYSVSSVITRSNIARYCLTGIETEC